MGKPRKAANSRKSAAGRAPRASVPPALLAKVRTLCLGLEGAYEEQAWVGTRWMVRKRNFAHVVAIAEGYPAAYARAAGSDGPLVVLTFRATDMLRDVLRDAGPRFFVPRWGTLWGTKVVGIKLAGRVDWAEVKTLLSESHRLLATTRAGAIPRRDNKPAHRRPA